MATQKKTASKPSITDEQMGFITSASQAITGWLGTEVKGKADVKALKEATTKAITLHRDELNLNLKALKMSKFKFTGTARSNPAIAMIRDAFIKAGQADGTANNSLAVVKACYDGDIGASHKFPSGLEVRDFNLARVKSGTNYFGLLDGKAIKVDRGDVSCAKSLIKAMEQEGFESVARNFIKSLGADPRKFTSEEIKVGFNHALTEAKLAVTKDGKLVAK